MSQGQYRIIRASGAEATAWKKPTIKMIRRIIGCDYIDTVVLEKDRHGQPTTIMVVDDTGMIDGKPVNDKATALVRKARGPQLFCIHGTVAVVDDRDWRSL